jgi:hypothetical protein
MVSLRTLAAPAALAVVVLTACDDPSGREQFGPVARVLERRCAATICHGVAPGAEEAGEAIDRTTRFLLDVDAAGRLADLDAAYDAARRRINTVERPEFSTLLRKPLALAAGGLPHEGGHPFGDRDHVDFQTLRAWIAAESGGGEGAPPEELTALQRHFADEVQPVLVARGCMVARCHGPLVMFGGLAFRPPMDGIGGDFSTEETRRNYDAARHNLALVGDGSRSRLVTKALPLDVDGVIHRGGNDVFFPHGATDPRDDPGVRAMIEWADRERDAQVGATAPDEPAGIVFVRGPAAPRGFLDLESFRPGSDVFYHPGLEAGATPINLTAAAHPGGPADVRDPAVSHDGTRVAFSMRTSVDDCANIYELRLDGGGLRQLTFDTGTLPGGGKVVNRWPTWGPGGDLVFSSSRAGVLDESARALDFELYELRGGAPLRLTYTPTPELGPRFLAVGEFRGTVSFTVIRRLNGFEAPVFRFPPDRAANHPQADYHPHHGQTAPGQITWTMRELPDGRDAAVLFDEDVVWEGGSLAVIERQLGPDVPHDRVADLSVPGFMHAVSVVDPTVTVSGVSPGGLYRDPAPLPDGRLVVAYAPGPIDLEDPAPATTPDTAIHVVTLANDADGMATIVSRELLIDAPGLADDQPAIVMVRPEEDDPHEWAWDPAAATGRLHLAGGAPVVVVNQSIQPLGAKPIPPGITGLRVTLWAGPTPELTPAVDPALVANGDPASTWWSNGVHGPTLLLAEAPLEPDGSIFVEAPAGAPVRVQVIDDNGWAVGRQLAFWIYLQGGWKLTAGAPLGRYSRMCSACHGSIDGDPGHALPPIDDVEADVVSSASITLATHEDRNPRRPLAPIPLATSPPPSFHFRRDLGPILERSCAVGGCHAGATPAAGLSLVPAPTTYYDAAYEALMTFGDGSTGGKRWVDERGQSARGSVLMERITGRELDAPAPLTGVCPPAGSGAPPLTPDEIAAIARWIDMGAIYRTPGVEEP